MITELNEEATEFGRQALRAFASAGGDRLAAVAEADPTARASLVETTLAELGAWDIDPRGSADEAEAAAALCRSAGYWAIAYPLAERLCRPRDTDIDGLLVVDAALPAAPIGGLDLRWLAVDLDGARSIATPRDGPLTPRKDAYVVPLDLEPLEAAGAVGASDLSLGLVLPCWTLLGMLDRAIELTCEYVLDRKQFGQPLASFQGVQFQMTDAEVERVGLEEQAKYALWSIEAGHPEALDDALALRVAAVRAAGVVFRVAHQCHGAIGFCDETMISWVSRASIPIRRLPFGASATRSHLLAQIGRRGLTGLFRVGSLNMDFDFSESHELFRREVQAWMGRHLVGEFAALGKGSKLGEGDELQVRKAWERELASGGWVGLGWPTEYGGRDLSLTHEIIFNEEYMRAGGPNRVGWFGENLLGPTLMMFGTDEQKRRFLPRILDATELWCQGFSEPDAGSDLANVKTRAERDGDEWVINGQKVWTSLGHIADWIFLVCKTDPQAPKKHQGISFLLCPMDQQGVELRPIEQMTGTAEFNEVFFTDARAPADLVVGEVDEGWKVVHGTLGFERGTAFLGEQLRWFEEFHTLRDFARDRGLSTAPPVRQRLADVYIGLTLIRLNGLRALSQTIRSGSPGPEATIGKLQWSTWHQQLGDLSMELMGPEGLILADGDTGDRQYTFLFSRAETIFAGSSEIQRNIIGERVLGLPREPS